MNLQRVEKLDCQDGDIVILRVRDVNNDELSLLFAELQKIKQSQTKDVHYLVFPNEWAKLVNVQITDAKGRLFQVDKLIKQLIRIEDRLQNRIRIQGTADRLTEKLIQNMKYLKNQRQDSMSK